MVTLIQSKAANPQMPLTLEGSLAVFKYAFEQGRADAQRALGRTVILVVGTTGVGKSTFLNFLAGCTMVSKTKKSLGMKGVGTVVVVKPVSEGGRRDELVKIVHGHVSLSVLPNITVDQETDMCFCECPGLLENRGTEINIANAVNLVNTFSLASEAKVVVVVDYRSLGVDRSRTLSDFITVCTKPFGTVDKLKQHLESVLIVCTHFPPDCTLEDVKGELVEASPALMVDLVERIFLVDVLGAKDDCLEHLFLMPAIANPADVFDAMLLESDEKNMIKMVMEMKGRMENCLLVGDYQECHKLYSVLEEWSVIRHTTVERIVCDCYMFICKHFVKEAAKIRQYCLSGAFDEAESVVDQLTTAAALFRGDAWDEVLTADQLVAFYFEARARHAQLRERQEAVAHELGQVANLIEELDSELQHVVRTAGDCAARADIVTKDHAEQVERLRALFVVRGS